MRQKCDDGRKGEKMYIQTELKNRDFYKKTVHLMLPVILQQLITIGVNFFDNLMVGSFGEIQIAAASFSNQFYSLFQFICMGLGSGAVVMSSQFWGRKELSSMRRVAAIALRVTLAICAVFTAVAVSDPSAVLRIFTNDGAVIQAGSPYLRLIALTLLLSGLSSTATYLLRSVGEVRVPLIGSAVAFFVNIFFNWIFIFGKFGAPRLELVGAALGTLIARVFEFCIVFGYFIAKDDVFGFRVRHLLMSARELHRQYVQYSIPVLISDTLLGLSLSLVSIILGHVGSNISAASAIIGSITQVTTVLNVGMAGASAIVVGNTVGEGDYEKAKREGNTYVILSFLFGIIIILPLLLLEKPYVGLYNITEETRQITHSMMLITCATMPIQTVAYITSKGILRGGGDTRFLLFADSSMVWLVSLPLGALASFVWNMSPAWIYFFLRVEFPLKGIICMARYLTGKWINVIRGEEAAKDEDAGR